MKPAKIKPPAVENIETFWATPPPERSPRCTYWVAELASGWVPNRRVRSMGYYEQAEFFGVYVWEHLHVLSPMLGVRVGTLPADED